MIELLLQADRALTMGLVDEAEYLYRQTIAADPRNSIAVVGLARVALERSDEVEAWRQARRALAIDPQNVAARRIVERLEQRWQEWGEALPDGAVMLAPEQAPVGIQEAPAQPHPEGIASPEPIAAATPYPPAAAFQAAEALAPADAKAPREPYPPAEAIAPREPYPPAEAPPPAPAIPPADVAPPPARPAPWDLDPGAEGDEPASREAGRAWDDVVVATDRPATAREERPPTQPTTTVGGWRSVRPTSTIPSLAWPRRDLEGAAQSSTEAGAAAPPGGTSGAGGSTWSGDPAGAATRASADDGGDAGAPEAPHAQGAAADVDEGTDPAADPPADADPGEEADPEAWPPPDQEPANPMLPALERVRNLFGRKRE